MANTIRTKESLSNTHPELAQEWDWEKNAPLTPDDVTYGVHKKVGWICKCGHKWDETVDKRTMRSYGCPYCSGKRVLVGFNDLSTKNSDLAKEWNYEKNAPLTPYDVTSHSGKKVWWKGQCGHEWPASIADRFDGRGCPYCSGRKVLVGFNDLATINSELAKEWHPTKNNGLLPTEVTSGSSKKVWWIGKCGHEWKAAVDDRVRGHGCHICAGRKVLVGVNDLESQNPELAKEWHPVKNRALLPSQVTIGANRNVWWKCSRCGNEWQATVATRKKGVGCSVCSGEKQTSFPEQALFFYLSQRFESLSRYNDGRYELDVFLPRCGIGVEYDGAYYHNDTKSKQREIRKENHFHKEKIRLIRVKESEKNAIVNDVVFYNVDPLYKMLPWAIQQVFRLVDLSVPIPDIDLDRDQGKIYEQYILKEKENSFFVVHPELAHEWDFDKNIIDPSSVSFSSGKKVWWRCSKCGKEWPASIAHRARGSGCPECSKKKQVESKISTLLKRQDSLQDAFPEIATEWHVIKDTAMIWE